MSSKVIKVEHLSKQYRIGAREGYRTFRETLVDAAKAPFVRLSGALSKERRAKSEEQRSEGNSSDSMLSALSSTQSSRSDDLIWALRDVSFEVKQGEVVGIIGRNGAGKSTLLKILSRITEPTEGRVELRGRVGSLLEVGTGFHPELTGHENIYLYGAILGMDRWEVTRKFDEIVAFAELEKFIDTPVKKYSSGMYMRLAFAVAAHLEPEILLVDEVLAVGDAAFQKKCLGKMGEVAKEGRTVLFVSHNMPAILALCQRGICIDSGAILSDQLAKTVVDLYLQSITTASQIPLAHRLDRQGNQEMRLLGFDLTDSDGRSIHHALSGQNVILAFHYRSAREVPLKNVHLSIGIHGRFDENLFHLSTNLVGGDFDEIPRLGTILCRIDRLPLQPGKYSFNFFSMVSREIADWVQNAGMIEVEAGNFFCSGKLPPRDQGPFLVPHAWTFEGEERLTLQGDES